MATHGGVIGAAVPPSMGVTGADLPAIVGANGFGFGGADAKNAFHDASVTYSGDCGGAAAAGTVGDNAGSWGFQRPPSAERLPVAVGDPVLPGSPFTGVVGLLGAAMTVSESNTSDCNAETEHS